MAKNAYWLSYDAREDRWRSRRWLWWLLLAPLIPLISFLAAIWLWPDEATTPDFAEPAAIQEALPALLTDGTTVVYVVDDSDSMWEKLLPLHQALHEVASKETENSEIAMLMFGMSPETLFDFTAPPDAPWEDAIPSFTAQSGPTNMYGALREALNLLPEEPTCLKDSHWLIFSETICRERRIVLMSDGLPSDPHLFHETVTALVESGIPVDTVAFGEDADERGLRLLSDATGGRFIEAR